MRSQAEALAAYEARMTGNPRGEAAKPEADMSEGELQEAVIDLAERLDYRVYHVAKVKGQLRSRTGKGFGDLIMARAWDGRLLYVELKSETGTMDEDQQAWMYAIRQVAETNATVQAHLWRPEHWHDGTIEGVLR